MPEKTDFFTLNELLLNIGAVHSPAELQGLLCGRVSGGDVPPRDAWVADAQTFLDIEHVALAPDHIELLQALYSDTRALMDDVNFSFSPLLPTDDATIARRTQELGAWCQGFLHGLGVSGLSGEAKLSPDAADALRDLAQISQASLEDDDNLDENEVYWLELVEYVKVAVLTIYTELSSAEPSSPARAEPNGGSEGNQQVLH